MTALSQLSNADGGEVTEWLREKKVPGIIEAMVSHLIQTRPEDPLEAIQEWISRSPRSPDAPPAQKRRVAVYGGAFNPITNAHLSCAAQILHSGLVEEVLLVPSGNKRGDKSRMEPFHHRITMCEIALCSAFSRDFHVHVSQEEAEMEKKEGKEIQTFELLTHLTAKHPGNEYHFVVGSDWLQPQREPKQDLRDWHPELAKNFHFIVLERPGFACDFARDGYDPEHFRMLKSPGSDFNFIDSNLSSTEIRKRAARGQTGPSRALDRLHLVEGLCARGVVSYIARYNLYIGA
eukprot:TRINITY_DN60042_c0_g1_i1.p1 TRINITY_DN60042_c0_g1~~TRINITY_DN60042_c0_g1_i1.p1  ORF type:complete len:291 (+),score=69.50 TRINITY_DN60042_c0_g1_i1:86-958(+)